MKLQNERLTAEIASPGEPYDGSRFDWTGQVTQVTLDGRHAFCAPASLRPQDDPSVVNIQGLCGEFGIFAPLGFDDAKPGEQFPKLGVGLLTRPDGEPYKFWRPYAVQPFEVETAAGATSITFHAKPSPCQGIAAAITKTISLSGARLSIRCEMHNLGVKPIVTHEYNHNFLAIDGHGVGPDYRLLLPYEIQLSEVPEPLAVAGREIRWRQEPQKAFYCRPVGFGPGDRHYWDLRHAPSGAGVQAGGDFLLHMLALWGVAHTVCPEAFIDIHLAPGGKMAWTRWYEFYRGAE